MVLLLLCNDAVVRSQRGRLITTALTACVTLIPVVSTARVTYLWLCCSFDWILFMAGPKIINPQRPLLYYLRLTPCFFFFFFCIQYSRSSITMKVLAEMRRIWSAHTRGQQMEKWQAWCTCLFYLFGASLSYSASHRGLIFLQGSGGHALSFLQKIVSQDFNLWLLDVTKHNIRNTYVSYLPFFSGYK